MNLIGTIPGFHSSSANISVTLALGVVVFLYVQFEGFRQNGFGHIMHFMGPKDQLWFRAGGGFPLAGPADVPH